MVKNEEYPKKAAFFFFFFARTYQSRGNKNHEKSQKNCESFSAGPRSERLHIPRLNDRLNPA